jgi:hypothetical protein
MLAKFGKFSFEHFAWGQVMLYYNHVNTVTKDHILGKAWEAQLAKIAQPSLETAPGTTHIHLTHLVGVKGQSECQMLWCNTHNI